VFALYVVTDGVAKASCWDPAPFSKLSSAHGFLSRALMEQRMNNASDNNSCSGTFIKRITIPHTVGWDCVCWECTYCARRIELIVDSRFLAEAPLQKDLCHSSRFFFSDNSEAANVSNTFERRPAPEPGALGSRRTCQERARASPLETLLLAPR